MSRMHSRHKGKSGSTKPFPRQTPEWAEQDAKKVESLVVDLVKTGKSAAQIGIALRDTHGVPDVRSVTKKKISEILVNNKVAPKLPQDLIDLLINAERIKTHFKENPKDMDAKRGVQLTESKIHRLSKYYKSRGILPKTWKGSEVRVELLKE